MNANYVLVDFENVQPDSLDALNHDPFKVLVFVGASQTKVPFDTAASLQRMGSRAEYLKVSGNGKNALDFHIAFHLGKLAATDASASFHVVSRDTGFDPLIQYLKAHGIAAARVESVSAIRAPRVESAPPQPRRSRPASGGPGPTSAELHTELMRHDLFGIDDEGRKPRHGAAADRARQFIEKLRKPKMSRPRSVKTLTSTVAAFFNKQLSSADVAAVVAAMQHAGFITIKDGKLAYVQPA